MDSRASARCRVDKSPFTTKVVSSGASADGSYLFVNDNVSGNETLKSPNGASGISFLSSHKLAAVEPSCVKLSWIPF